jgi:8-amino-7-oxononanoate synthase
MSTKNEVLRQIRDEFLQAPRRRSLPAPRLRDLPDDVTSFESHEDFLRVEDMKAIYERTGLRNPYFIAREGTITNTIDAPEGRFTTFSGYNYLGLSCDPRGVEAAQRALSVHGTAAGAARLVGGEIPLHRTLEAELAAAIGVEDCVVGVGGYSTNVATIRYVCDSRDVILHDEYMHNSGVMGAMLSGARRIAFPHNDYAALEALLREHRTAYRRALVLIEGAYSMDGDIPDLPRVLALKERYKALLMVDEAHSIGVLRPRGLGIADHFGVDPRRIDIVMGTLSKSLASCGGFIGGSRALIDAMRYFAPGMLLYSTGLPPGAAAAALESLRIMLDEPVRLERLHDNAAFFVERARAAGLDTGPSQGTAVVPVMLGAVEGEFVIRLMSQLMDAGVIVHGMMHPVVPKDQTRLRFFITSDHTHVIERLAALLGS